MRSLLKDLFYRDRYMIMYGIFSISIDFHVIN
jgi:hypothetical protein